MIHKIYKFLSSYEKNKIKKLIEKCYSEKDILLEISKIVVNAVTHLQITPDKSRQDFIIEKILQYINNNYPYLLQNNCKVIDIGGGNGNVISGLRNNLNIVTNASDFICYETLTDWAESYTFDNTNITYKFVNNNNKFELDLPENCVDIVFFMVSLHHMTTNNIIKVLENVFTVLKPNGKVLIKEHNATSKSNPYILWEHHLYHILDCAYNNKIIDIDKYYNTTIYNFKSREDWNFIFKTVGFELVDTKNRFLDGNYVYNDEKNASELYWAVYQKK
jgi:ubiquinone/menaquinone biosynthesis C-methylase UbiE